MQVLYATERLPHMEGREFRNPRHFLAPVDGATKVYIAGHWPNVRRAYEKAGVPVAPAEDMRALPKPKAVKATAAKPRKPAAVTVPAAVPVTPTE